MKIRIGQASHGVTIQAVSRADGEEGSGRGEHGEVKSWGKKVVAQPSPCQPGGTSYRAG